MLSAWPVRSFGAKVARRVVSGRDDVKANRTPSARMMLPFLPRVKILFRVVFQFVFLVWVTLNEHKWITFA